MSYYREARKDEIVAFLTGNYWNSDHDMIIVDAGELAEALINRFDVLTTSDTPA